MTSSGLHECTVDGGNPYHADTEELLMPAAPHVERHFTATAAVRDVVIGMSDGLTVPFALAAGLSGAVASSHIVVTAGLAEIAAGSIAMGLGGYLAARTDAEHYRSERLREEREIVELPERETEEVAEIFRGYGLAEGELAPVVAAIRAEPKRWVDFMMKFELGLEAPDPSRARNSALTIAAAYVAGGLIPLTPYMLVPGASAALLTFVAVPLPEPPGVGVLEGRLPGTPPGGGGP